MTATSLITGVDFAMVPTQQFETAVAFYGETLGLARPVFRPDRGFAEFETGNLTLDVTDVGQMGMPFHASPNPIALHVDDVAHARAELESRGVEFRGEILDTGVCHMAFFADADGNALMLHHRYAPRVTESDT